MLLLQLNAELPNNFPGHERRLYVFTCRRKTCRRKEGSTRVLRGVRVSPNAPAPITDPKPAKPTPPPAPDAASQGIGEALFGVKTAPGARVNPFSSSSTAAAVKPANPFASSSSGANPFAPKSPPPTTESKPVPKPTPIPTTADTLPATFAATLSLNNTQPPPAPSSAPEPWPSHDLQPTPFPVRWLSDAEYETLDPESTKLPANVVVAPMEIDSGPGSGSAGGKEDKDVFESHMDAVFQAFADRVGQNSEQCLRYEFAGAPLLYSKVDGVGRMLYAGSGGEEKVKVAKGMPRCGNCGAGRVFEVQLTPQAIEEVEGEEEGMEGMDWGTVIVGVCEKDCQEKRVGAGEAGYVEEWVGVQWEELSVKR